MEYETLFFKWVCQSICFNTGAISTEIYNEGNENQFELTN